MIGEVFRADAAMGGYKAPGKWWRTSKSISGGVLYDWGVHLLEYCLQIMTSDMVEVSGFAKEGYWESKASQDFPWKGDANEDDAAAVVRFANGSMLNLNISHLRSYQDGHTLKFFGTKGCYLLDFETWTTRIANRKGELVEKTGKHPKGQQHLFYKNIADYLTGQDELIITPQWARRPIHVLDLADRSAKQNKTLKTKYS